jgi:hypothetical protein
VTVLKSISTSAALVIATYLTAVVPLAEAGQIYRCVGNDGSIEFSNLLCPPNTAVSVFTVKPNFVDIPVAREQVRQDTQRRDDGIASDVSAYDDAAVPRSTINAEFGRERAEAMQPFAVPMDGERIRARRIAPEPRRAVR